MPILGTAALMHAASSVVTGNPTWRWLWQIAISIVLTTTFAATLRRFAGERLQFESRRQVVVYVLASFLVPGVFALALPAFIRSCLGIETAASPMVTWLRSDLALGTAMLLIVPPVVLWGRRAARPWRSPLPSLPRMLEAGAVIVSIGVVGMLVFGTGPELANSAAMILLIMLPLLWAAVRFGPFGASSAILGIAALSAWGMLRQLGPFVATLDADQVISLQAFWVVLCVPIMLLSASISERTQVETALAEQRAQLAHLTRVATAGEWSGLLAHELHQPLAAILANAEAATVLLGKSSVNVPELQEILSDIKEADRQAGDVVNRLRAFLKKGEPRFDRVELEPLVRDAVALGRTAIRNSGAELIISIEPALPQVRGDRVQLLQIVVNLIVNGCEAMHHVAAQNRRLWVRAQQARDGEVEVLVADRGDGVPPGSEARVFEPFFSTKENGLGLGLSISRSIANAHGGRLWAENNTGGGATFHLVLPRRGAA